MKYGNSQLLWNIFSVQSSENKLLSAKGFIANIHLSGNNLGSFSDLQFVIYIVYFTFGFNMKPG